MVSVYVPQAMYCPRVLGTDSWISIPKLGLQEVTSGIIKAASVLTLEFRLTTQFRLRTRQELLGRVVGRLRAQER